MTIDGVTHDTSRNMQPGHSYRTIDIATGSTVQAVVLLSGDRVIPQWVIHGVDGFNGSFWHGGMGNARADRAHNTYTVAGELPAASAAKTQHGGVNRLHPRRMLNCGF